MPFKKKKKKIQKKNPLFTWNLCVSVHTLMATLHFAGKKTINRVEFSTCLNELKNETHNGFTEEEVEILIDALISTKNLGKLFYYCTFSETCFEKKLIF